MTAKRLSSAPQSSATQLRFPLLWNPKKSLNYTMQHCSQLSGPCVQTDINVTGLMVKGPRVSVCPRAPGHSVTPLPPPPSVPFQSCTKLSPRLSYVTFHSFHMEFHTTQSVISSFTCLSFCCTGNLLKLFIGLSAMTSTIWESD